MRKFVAILGVLVATLFIFCAPSYAQKTTTTKPSIFTKKVDCDDAIKTANFAVYKPQYDGLKKKNPVDDVKLFLYTNEGLTCDRTLVVGGYKYVVSDNTIQFRVERLADGRTIKRYRHDCGNPVIPEPEDLVTPAPTAVVAATPTPAPAPEVEVVKVAEGVSVKIDIKNIIKMEEVAKLNNTPVAVQPSKKGFCSSKKCRLGALLGAGAAGYAAYYYAPCWKK